MSWKQKSDLNAYPHKTLQWLNPNTSPYPTVPVWTPTLTKTSDLTYIPPLSPLLIYTPSSLASCSLYNHSIFLPQNLCPCCSLCLECSPRFQHGCTPTFRSLFNLNSSESHSLANYPAILMVWNTTWKYTFNYLSICLLCLLFNKFKNVSSVKRGLDLFTVVSSSSRAEPGLQAYAVLLNDWMLTVGTSFTACKESGFFPQKT